MNNKLKKIRHNAYRLWRLSAHYEKRGNRERSQRFAFAGDIQMKTLKILTGKV